jgi:hypothetical protein
MSEKASMAQPAGKTGLGVVLSSSYAVGSVMLWITYFMGLVIFYALIAAVGPSRSLLVTYLAPGFAVVYGATLLVAANGDGPPAGGLNR